MAFFINRRSAAIEICGKVIPDFKHPAIILVTSPDGLELGAELAHVLKITFDLLIIEEIGLKNSSCVMGELIEDAPPYIFENFNLAKSILGEVKKQKKKNLLEKKSHYRDRRNLDLKGFKTIILVDDAFIYPKRFDSIIVFLKKQNSFAIQACSPVVDSSILKKYQSEIDFFYIKELKRQVSIENIYQNFSPISDEEIKSILKL